MRIAFDLDDTLIPAYPGSFAVERPRGLLGRLLAPELLREGSARLLGELARAGCDLWVYTTSLRRPLAIRLLFRCYGVRLGGVVNQDVHLRWMRRRGNRVFCSKYPPAFGIDLLVDDSAGVWEEGREFGFRVLHVRPDDRQWGEKVLAAAGRGAPRPPAAATRAMP
jgi:hypothetical protein